MKINKLSEKSIAGSLLRISLAICILVFILCTICLIYLYVTGVYPYVRYNIKLSKPEPIFRYNPNPREPQNTQDKQQSHDHETGFTEKVSVLNKALTNWDTKIADLCKNTGFKGKINNEDPKFTTTWKVRTFEYMEGTFNLPEPMDTVTFRRNADFLVKNVLALYKGEKKDFSLTKQPITGAYFHNLNTMNGLSANYEQKRNFKTPGLFDMPIYYGLQITYNYGEKSYYLLNRLYSEPLFSPKDKVGKEAALRIAKKELKQQHKDKNIMVQYRLSPSLIDTLSSNIRKVYIVRYPEMKSPHYYYVQSVWCINFPWVWYGKYEGYDITYDEDYTVDAYSGEVYGE